jgi:hypothetical protein
MITESDLEEMIKTLGITFKELRIVKNCVPGLGTPYGYVAPLAPGETITHFIPISGTENTALVVPDRLIRAIRERCVAKALDFLLEHYGKEQ